MISILLVVLTLLVAQPPAPTPPSSPTPAAPAKAENTAAIAKPRTDAGWVTRNESFLKRAQQGSERGDIGVVFLGDSITQGWEGAGKDVWAKAYAPRHAVNFGIGGDQTQHVLWRIQNGNLEGLDQPEKGSPPKLAIIMIGTNNLANNTPAQIADGIGAIVHGVREKLPQAKVLLLAVFPRAKNAIDPARAKIAELNTLAAKLADNKTVWFEDIGAKFLSPDGSLSADIMPDFLHLSPKGYQIWADAIEPRVRELLGETSPVAQPPSE